MSVSAIAICSRNDQSAFSFLVQHDVTAARSLKTEITGSRTREVRSHCVFKLPFGEELFAGTDGRTAQQGYTNSDGARQKFTQKERDNETGLDYFGARYYGSTQGRFTSPDPLLSSGIPAEPRSWNR